MGQTDLVMKGSEIADRQTDMFVYLESYTINIYRL